MHQYQSQERLANFLMIKQKLVLTNIDTMKRIDGMFETWYKVSSMIRAGLDVSPVITHRYHYSEFEKAFQTMISGQSGKVVLDWSD